MTTIAPNVEHQWNHAGFLCFASIGVPRHDAPATHETRKTFNDIMGEPPTFCGYVVLPPNHPLHGANSDEIWAVDMPLFGVSSVEYGAPFGEGGWIVGFTDRGCAKPPEGWTVDQMTAEVNRLADHLGTIETVIYRGEG